MYWRVVAGVVGLVAVLCQVQLEEDPEVLQTSVVLMGTSTAVYRYASDFKLYAKWFPTVYSYESLDERSMAVGKQYSQLSYIPWIGERKHTILIVDYDPPRFLAYIEDAWSLPKVEIYVESVDSKHTRFTWRLTSRWRNGLFKYVVAPVLKFFYGGRTKQAMLNLRALFQK